MGQAPVRYCSARWFQAPPGWCRCMISTVPPSLTRRAWLVLSACLYWVLGYATLRTQFAPLAGLFALLFWGYWLRVRPLRGAAGHPQPDRFLLGAAVFFRLLLLLALPALSDDYARFIWDGKLLLQGVNPFRYLPAEVMAGGLTDRKSVV